ncbi:MAG: 7,8-didemethyl-8-hydroxy-5-deazariboflavin synthase subunit CofH [Chloroflexi bacterium]|jgi:FO synthase subunit 2|nr:5-amino-6-(D-ribitylamino)uracil--L-tyrosine 4-hydroxyphenyl transferase CofH [Dehalococcoidia bacterium]PKB82970.1 MAG: 7,8-didemethyl-8-hydroxy-5-deazariboflavin synthase subunit CofH [SAR202 cluster bacterium MP-SInd-SRR3963457-G1]PKB85135.1 MAG: 7,8-didemethyl-8-hydroxy-5-deazariboflavin synthase subunit CofH [SAR202 cluster bacterium MP-NPac-SRR3961935-G1]RUA20985.1 MAG: 7,8-didemethyl-8-hydroxy-5-deazariboflavin synthase subunit CofH [Chloroflexota bacterium]|tara:strand:+ start:1137 stop:2444 length:1308 start_codon:yes stop_codon:yes gene_type:complete
MTAESKGNNQVENLGAIIGGIRPETAAVLDRALSGEDITSEEAVVLFGAEGQEYNAMVMTADELRRRTVGDIVTYVVNRNINFTNVCIKGCGFCAFSRDFREDEGYLLPTEEIIRRAKEAWDYGATEVCVQAGLPPKMEGDLYIRLCEALKKELPDMHIHGFSPEEVLYGSIRSEWTIRQYLTELKAAGVGSLPGTSAEVLDQELRDKISPGRITVDQWTEVITTAHELGIPTTSTVMFGFLETPIQLAKHMDLIRGIQQQTGGITEFVPLSFVHTEAPMFMKGLVDDVRPGPTGIEVIKMHAIARIMLNNWIPNIQASWVKEGPRMSQLLLTAGVNDLGGTLINESISTAAGAQHGQLMRPSEFRQMIRQAGRIPAERYTTYKTRRVFSDTDQELDPLDLVGDNVEEVFGSYARLVKLDTFRFEHPNKAPIAKV